MREGVFFECNALPGSVLGKVRNQYATMQLTSRSKQLRISQVHHQEPEEVDIHCSIHSPNKTQTIVNLGEINNTRCKSILPKKPKPKYLLSTRSVRA